VRAFALLLGVQAKRTLREPPAAFFLIAFAPLYTVIMGLIFGNAARPEFGGRGYLDANLAGFAAIVVAISSFVLVPVDIVTQRESGALRRFRATPLRPLTFIAADVLVRFAGAVVSIVLALVLGIVAFGAEPSGSLAAVVGAVMLGVLAFLAAGYVLAAAVPTQGAALVLANVLVYPLIMLSGSAVPLAVLPDNVRRVARYSPLTQLVELLQRLWQGGAWTEAWLPLVVLVGLFAVGTALAASIFRWE